MDVEILIFLEVLMIQISEYNETQLANMAAVVGKSVDDFWECYLKFTKTKSM